MAWGSHAGAARAGTRGRTGARGLPGYSTVFSRHAPAARQNDGRPRPSQARVGRAGLRRSAPARTEAAWGRGRVPQPPMAVSVSCGGLWHMWHAALVDEACVSSTIHAHATSTAHLLLWFHAPMWLCFPACRVPPRSKYSRPRPLGEAPNQLAGPPTCRDTHTLFSIAQFVESDCTVIVLSHPLTLSSGQAWEDSPVRAQPRTAIHFFWRVYRPGEKET